MSLKEAKGCYRNGEWSLGNEHIFDGEGCLICGAGKKRFESPYYGQSIKEMIDDESK